MPEDLATPSGSVKKKTDMEETMNNNTDKASPSPLDSMEENTLPTPFSSSSSSKYKIPTSSPSFLHSTYPRTTTPSFTSKSKFTASTSNIEPLISHLHHLLKELKQHHQFTSSTQENYLVLQKKQALHTQLCTQKYQDHVHQLTTYQETLKTIMVLLQCDTIDSVVPTIAALQHQVAHQSEQLLEIQSTLDSIEVEWHRISNDGKLLQANVQHLQSITDQNKLDVCANLKEEICVC
ncbi:hypothetical protein HMI54_002971 [Coelomomyces lativittatus]|nr:hypothetical protein HMI56_005204 [Coelomomyces lativittatus]KAJ1500700.1 hypothetical protein HMI55_003770 [Coelomomyces lativittatus]KAJ1518035.1 hypothetical protein HMI54_002971 [Coelomomyces lativittatus]